MPVVSLEWFIVLTQVNCDVDSIDVQTLLIWPCNNVISFHLIHLEICTEGNVNHLESLCYSCWRMHWVGSFQMLEFLAQDR